MEAFYAQNVENDRHDRRAAGGAAILVSAVFFIAMRGSSEAQQQALGSTMNGDFDRLARLEVETAVSMLSALEKLEAEGRFAKGEAKAIGVAVLRMLRYNKEGYFWADDSKGKNVVLLGNKTEGTNRLESKDAKGFSFIRLLLEKGMAGGGYTDYWFPKAGSDIAAILSREKAA